MALCLLMAALPILPSDTAHAAPVATIRTHAGNGSYSFCGDGGPATDACFFYASGVAVDSSGNAYVTDVVNSRVRRVDASSGAISTYAGNGTYAFCGDGGPSTGSCLHNPYGIAINAADEIYVADTFNNRIRKIGAGGTISTYVIGLSSPSDVSVDAAGNLYVVDANSIIRKIDTNGVGSIIAGQAFVSAYCGDGGPATAACFNFPAGVAADNAGNVYVADEYNHRIRRIDSNGDISTFAGDGTEGFCGDGGPATAACLDNPTGVAVDALGRVYIADKHNNRIRRVGTNGVISTIAGSGTEGHCGDGGDPTAACLYEPYHLDVDAIGTVFVAEFRGSRVRSIQTAELVFASAPHTLQAGQSGVIDLELRTGTGAPSRALTPVTIALTSSSQTARFRNLADTAPITSVTIPAGGYQASFRFSDTRAGFPNVEASALPYEPVSQTQTVLPGPATSLTLALHPDTLHANGTDTSIALSTVADEFGNPRPNDVVTLSTSGDASVPPLMQANGDGTYTATITASLTLGDETITAVNGSLTAQAILHEIVGDPVHLTIVASRNPVRTRPSEIDSSVLTVTAFDSVGHRVPGATIEFTTPVTMSGPGIEPVGPSVSPASMITDLNGQADVLYRAGPFPGVDVVTATVTTPSGSAIASIDMHVEKSPDPAGSCAARYSRITSCSFTWSGRYIFAGGVDLSGRVTPGDHASLTIDIYRIIDGKRTLLSTCSQHSLYVAACRAARNYYNPDGSLLYCEVRGQNYGVLVCGSFPTDGRPAP